MKRLIYYYCYTGLTILLILTGCKQNKKSENSKDQSYKSNSITISTPINPVLDQNFPDPTVIKAADGYYYAYATNTAIDGKPVNIQVSKSKDLIQWDKIKDAFPKKPSWAQKDLWAPHVIYDSEKQTYFLYYSAESKSDTYGKCMGVATSKSPLGPFVDKGTPLLCGEGFVNIDPMAFDDPTTNKKLLYWGSGFQAIKVQELKENRLEFKDGSRPIELVHTITNDDPNNYQRLVEGAWVEKYNDFYYLYYSGDNCCGESAHYAVMVARSKSATGPFVSYAESNNKQNSVILKKNHKWIAPGHNSIVKDQNNQSWIVYHAIDSEDKEKGRVLLMDKLNYKDGWPIISNGTPSVE